MALSETVLILMLLLAVGMVASGLLRRLPVPYTVLLVIIGMLLETAADAWEPLAPLRDFQLSPELVLFVFLPTLIFESGLNLNSRQLVKDIAPVMVLAVPALLFSTAVVGVGMWLDLPIPLTTALLFGALISATDPVAVIALFKELGAPQRLTVLVEGESLLNDATAIVTFNILLGLTAAGAITWGEAGGAVLEFVKVFFGGALVGVGFGLTSGWAMQRLRAVTAEVLILSLVTAYVSFILADHHLHVSGVMAVAGAAVTLGVFGVARLPHETGEALGETWEFLALICNTLLFMLVGLSVDFSSLLSRFPSILLAVLLVMFARASMIYTLVPSTTRVFSLPRVSMGERHIMLWGGLKGGLAIAIVLSIPPDLPGRQLLLDITLGVVLFTLLVNAPTIRPLIHWLGIDRLTSEENAELVHGAELANLKADGMLDRLHRAGILSRAGRHQVQDNTHEVLHVDAATVSDAHRASRQRLETLRVELEAVEDLYKVGVLPQYTFLDLKGELQRKREHIAAGVPPGSQSDPRAVNPFIRLEDALIHRLREQNWAAGLLARYQNSRTSQHLLKDIAHLLMAEAALEHIQGAEGLVDSERRQLEDLYRRRLGFFTDNVSQVRRDYPDFYRRFETRLALRSALARALRQVEEEYHAGSLGAKPYTVLSQRLRQALDRVPPVSEPVPEPEPTELVGMVPLLAGLPEQALEETAGRTRAVNFLSQDTIIGEGEHGDALYIVARGRVGVYHGSGETENFVAELGMGDFFGETALLGDQVRTATVRALQPCTLLRLTRKDVLDIAQKHPTVSERLEEAQRARLASS